MKTLLNGIYCQCWCFMLILFSMIMLMYFKTSSLPYLLCLKDTLYFVLTLSHIQQFCNRWLWKHLHTNIETLILMSNFCFCYNVFKKLYSANVFASGKGLSFFWRRFIKFVRILSLKGVADSHWHIIGNAWRNYCIIFVTKNV